MFLPEFVSAEGSSFLGDCSKTWKMDAAGYETYSSHFRHRGIGTIETAEIMLNNSMLNSFV